MFPNVTGDNRYEYSQKCVTVIHLNETHTMRGEQEVEAVPQRPRRIYFGQMPRSSVNIDREIPTEGFRGCMHHFQVSLP